MITPLFRVINMIQKIDVDIRYNILCLHYSHRHFPILVFGIEFENCMITISNQDSNGFPMTEKKVKSSIGRVWFQFHHILNILHAHHSVEILFYFFTFFYRINCALEMFA